MHFPTPNFSQWNFCAKASSSAESICELGLEKDEHHELFLHLFRESQDLIVSNDQFDHRIRLWNLERL